MCTTDSQLCLKVLILAPESRQPRISDAWFSSSLRIKQPCSKRKSSDQKELILKEKVIANLTSLNYGLMESHQKSICHKQPSRYLSLSLFRSVFLECKYIYLECKYILGCVNLMHRNKILLFWIHYVLNNIKRSFKLPLIKHLNYIFSTHRQLGCLYFSLDDEMVKFTLLVVFFFIFHWRR